jgi:hypothetical protein
MPVRRHHQQAVRETLENLTDAGLAGVRAAPDAPAASEEDSICAVVGLSAFLGRGVQMGMFCSAPVQRALFASKRPDGSLFTRWIED